MSDYVPTTEQVKRAYVEGVEHDCYYEGDVTITPDGIYEANRFNAWLTEYTREKQAEAWNACEDSILEKLVGATEITATLANAWPRNPYRAEKNDE